MGAYWNNHHYTLHTVQTVNGKILWSNLFFLFWISLLPFMTNWMSKNPSAWIPTLAYGIILFMTAIGYTVLQQTIIKTQQDCDVLKQAVADKNRKGIFTGILYIAALCLTPFAVHLSQIIYAVLLILWFMPDRKISQYFK